MSLTGLILLTALGIQPPPRDPYLPDAIREVVEKASAAELDPKRGTSNAVEILKGERAKRPLDSPEVSALDLRSAATILRAKFISSNEFAEPVRHQQVLSTYTRLDLWDPGLTTFLDRALEHNPDAKKKLGKKQTWKIKAAILIRGSGLDRETVAAAFKKALQKVGVGFEMVPIAEAPFAMVLSAEDAPSNSATETAVQLTFGAERIVDKNVVWRTTYFRTEKARELKVALASALEWTARIGGRDVFFRWLGESAFPMMADNRPGFGGISPAGEHEQSPLGAEIKKPEPKTR